MHCAINMSQADLHWCLRWC